MINNNKLKLILAAGMFAMNAAYAGVGCSKRRNAMVEHQQEMTQDMTQVTTTVSQDVVAQMMQEMAQMQQTIKEQGKLIQEKERSIQDHKKSIQARKELLDVFRRKIMGKNTGIMELKARNQRFATTIRILGRHIERLADRIDQQSAYILDLNQQVLRLVAPMRDMVANKDKSEIIAELEAFHDLIQQRQERIAAIPDGSAQDIIRAQNEIMQNTIEMAGSSAQS